MILSISKSLFLIFYDIIRSTLIFYDIIASRTADSVLACARRKSYRQNTELDG